MTTHTTDMLPIECPYFQQAPENIHAARELLSKLKATPMGQSWLPAPQPEFLPASAAAFWTEAELGIVAELHDREIGNSSVGENQRFWETGDVFEVFVRPLPAEPYWEFHVTPENHRLQLLYPSEQSFRDRDKVQPQPANWLDGIGLPPNSFKSESLVLREQELWYAYALVPWSLFGLQGAPKRGEEWLASFCRYDATKGQAKPVVSTTSLPKRPDFHENSSWRVMKFV